MTARIERPELNEARCTGCGDCVAICPTECLALRGAIPWLPRPADCIACAACELICPVQAIQLVLRTHYSGVADTDDDEQPRKA